ncbi:MAG TPA: recombination protein NinG [Candidatus Lokiarchaeia archaeon]
MKELSIKTLKRKLWEKYVSPYIRQRDKGVCFTCGKIDDWRNQHCGHFIPRSKYSDIEFTEENLHCQCNKCNTYLSGNMREYTLRMIDMYGRSKVDELIQRSNIVKVWKIQELLDLIEYYKNKLKEL